MVTFTLDDRQVEVEEGLTVLQAARRMGVHIPTLCYYEGLSPYGACRLCLVEAVRRGGSRLYTACTYPVEDGLVIRTNSPRVVEARRMMVDLLYSRCPNVPVIQDLAREYGIERPGFPPEDKDCILCGLCVRACEEMVGKGILGFVDRGTEREVSTPFNQTSEECIACGACATVCPTGAIQIEGLDQAVMEALPLGPITAIYTPTATAVPKVPVVDREACIHFRTGGCELCAKLCDRQAINHEMEEQEISVPVGAVVVATGFEPYDACLSEEYGFGRFPNVLSSLQYERLLMAAGPTAGTVQRPSDGRHPKRIAFLQCIGSRDQHHPYCSSVCCMFATKHAILTVDHDAEASPTVFMMDMRAFGKGFDAYYQRAQTDYGVRYVRCRPSSVKEVPGSRNLLVRFQADDGAIVEEEFDLVVLSVGMEPAASMPALAQALGIELNQFGFCHTEKFTPLETTRPGIFACGPIVQPCDIPDSVVQGSGAAARSLELVGAARNTLTARLEYPPEVPLNGQEPRIGVFICHCGSNIAGVIDVRAVAEYAAALPNVAYATSTLYTCSQDNQAIIKQAIEEHKLNRLVVSACTPRTHEPLFQETLREAGLNPYLFEMANIRDQCSWVHRGYPQAALDKAKGLVRMAVARAAHLKPLYKQQIPVTRRALVVGGGIAGMTAALSLANQGYDATIVERELELGGYLRQVRFTAEGADPAAFLADLVHKVEQHPGIEVLKGAEVVDTSGFIGNFVTTVRQGGTERSVEHGATIVATGGHEYRGSEYLLGQDPRVITMADFEQMLAEGRPEVVGAQSIAILQCVGPEESRGKYCSRICCVLSLKNALRVKELSPDARVFVLAKDMRTYGFKELFYREAREKGVVFLRYDDEHRPSIVPQDGHLAVTAQSQVQGAEVTIPADLLVLNTAVVPSEGADTLSSTLKIPLTREGFFLEAHVKLRPTDFASEGLFLAGTAHYPKFAEEAIAQALSTAARAAGILSRDRLEVGGAVAAVDGAKCAACLTCVRVCPYQVPMVGAHGTAEIEAAECHGCGTCVSACPGKAIRLQHYEDEQILAKAEALLVGVRG